MATTPMSGEEVRVNSRKGESGEFAKPEAKAQPAGTKHVLPPPVYEPFVSNPHGEDPGRWE